MSRQLGSHSEAETQSGAGSTLAVISRRLVGLLKEHYGKGPTGARTYHVGDIVVVLMRGGYTQVERTLIESGNPQAVTDQRSAFQQAMGPLFKQVIEEEMRREVVAFMSASHHDPDMNAELFVLAPAGDAEEPPPIVVAAEIADAVLTDAAG